MSLFEDALINLDAARKKLDANNKRDEAIDELIDEAVKRLEADWAALIWENQLLSTQITSLEEAERVRAYRHHQRESWGLD